ncbi:MAG: serine/threonine protein kinase [Myxococcales bacterium]|nr:serine/threonine protein kinase [Myxococcales bacterium]
MSGNDLVFGKYEIQHRLAIGGMGEVFYALQKGIPGFERPVILKGLLPDLAAQQELVDQFLDEARVAATLNHPNVVHLFEVGLWNGTYFIAMEYIRGRNLSQLIRRAIEAGVDVPPLVAARVIADAAQGLHHAHTAADAQGRALNIIHRDISPQNIMVRDDGVTKVVDFGIARASNRSTRTATGTLKGKLSYMAPEQLIGDQLTPAADQFALGVCFWEMLVGARLFKAEQDLQVVKKVLEEPIRPPSMARKGVPATFDAVVLKMLERSAAQRFPSCAEVAAAIDKRMGELSGRELHTPALFMRQLGTDDITLNIKRSGGGSKNFVISLGDQKATPSRPEDSVEVQLPTTPSSAKARSPGSRRPGSRGALIAAAAVGLGLAGAGAVFALRPDAPAPPEAQPAPPVVVEKPAEPAPPPTPPAPPPEAKPVRFEIVSIPPRASVRFDGKPMGETPVSFEAPAGGTHYLLAERAGYQRVEKEVVGAPGEALRVELTLPKAKRGGKSTAVSEEPGFLTLETKPWSKVTIDREYAGSTPLFKRKLAPGAHRLVLVNEGEGLSVTRDILIKPGETLKLSLALK